MITEDILNWTKTLPKWQQKLSYLLMENMNVDEAILMDVFNGENFLYRRALRSQRG